MPKILYSRVVLERTFLLFAKDLYKHRAVPVFGTLLGLVREGSFIDPDDDLDFLVPIDMKHKFVPLLRQCKTHKLVEYPHAVFMIPNDTKMYCNLDIYWSERVDHLNCLLERHDNHCSFPYDLMEPYNDQTFLGVPCIMPNKPEELCAWTYGPQWKSRMEKTYVWETMTHMQQMICKHKPVPKDGCKVCHVNDMIELGNFSAP